MTRTAGLLLVALALPIPGVAAQETVAPDRPGIGSGSTIIDAGMLQLEAGGQFSRAGALDQYSVGQGLLRLGVSGVELHAALGSWVTVRGDADLGDEDDPSGIEDLSLGAKVPLTAWEGGRLSVLVLASLPTGASFLTNDAVVPSATLLTDHALSDAWTLSANLGARAGPGAVDEQVSLTLTPGVALPGLPGLGAYFGYAGFYGTGSSHWAEGGFAWTPANDLQLDLNSAVELESGDFFLGLGFAVRREAW